MTGFNEFMIRSARTFTSHKTATATKARDVEGAQLAAAGCNHKVQTYV